MLFAVCGQYVPQIEAVPVIITYASAGNFQFAKTFLKMNKSFLDKMKDKLLPTQVERSKP